MTVTNSAFSLYPGESRELQIAVIDDDNGGIPLTGMGDDTITFELYREPAHTQILTKDSTSLDVTVIDDTNGIVQVVLIPDDTKYLVFGATYVYYLRVTNSSNRSGVVAKGTLNLEK